MWKDDVSLEGALQAMLEDGSVVAQAFAAIVVYDEEGTKTISHLRSTDLRTWEARGLVTDMEHALQALEVARMFEDE